MSKDLMEATMAMPLPDSDDDEDWFHTPVEGEPSTGGCDLTPSELQDIEDKILDALDSAWGDDEEVMVEIDKEEQVLLETPECVTMEVVGAQVEGAEKMEDTPISQPEPIVVHEDTHVLNKEEPQENKKRARQRDSRLVDREMAAPLLSRTANALSKILESGPAVGLKSRDLEETLHQSFAHTAEMVKRIINEHEETAKDFGSAFLTVLDILESIQSEPVPWNRAVMWEVALREDKSHKALMDGANCDLLGNQRKNKRHPSTMRFWGIPRKSVIDMSQWLDGKRIQRVTMVPQNYRKVLEQRSANGKPYARRSHEEKWVPIDSNFGTDGASYAQVVADGIPSPAHVLPASKVTEPIVKATPGNPGVSQAEVKGGNSLASATEDLKMLEEKKRRSAEAWTAKLHAYQSQIKAMREKILGMERDMKEDADHQEQSMEELNQEIARKKEKLEKEKKRNEELDRAKKEKDNRIERFEASNKLAKERMIRAAKERLQENKDKKELEKTTADRKALLHELERKLSSYPKQISTPGENVLTRLSKPIDYLLAGANTPIQPEFMGTVGETALWAMENQRFRAESLPESFTNLVKEQIGIIVTEEGECKLEDLQDLSILCNRLLIKVEMLVQGYVHQVLDETLVKTETLDWHWDRLPAKWQSEKEKGPDARGRFYRELRKSVRYYIMQRFGEFKRAVPVQMESAREMKNELAAEGNLGDILIINLENLLSKLWWIVNLDIGVSKDTDFPL